MKILVVEDQKLVCEMLVAACQGAVAGADVRSVGTGTDAVGVCRSFKPELMFLDLMLPDGDGFVFLPQCLAANPGMKVIALTSHADPFTLHRAIKARVDGFVDKNEQPLKVLQEAITTVMAGRTYFSSLAQRLRQAMREDPGDFTKVLSDHEQKLLGYFGAGLSNEDIAGLVGLTAGTVRIHRSNIMGKLNIHSTRQLMRYAAEKGFTYTPSEAALKPPRRKT